jgi:hypothetical protein
MKVPARVQYLVVVVLALAAIAFALPAMRDTPIEKFVIGFWYCMVRVWLVLLILVVEV